MKIEISLLKENPINKEIYGDDDPEQFNQLVEKITKTGWIKPIVINKDNIIISGHRRRKAALFLGRTEIEVEKIVFDENRELEILLAENAYRNKSTLQKVREAELYHKIEEKKAEERQLFGATLSANLQQGRTNDIVSENIGMSARSYHDARKVLHRLNEEQEDAVKWLFEETLNNSVDAASKLVDKSDDFLKEVIEKTEGDVKKITSVIREIEREEKIIKTNIPAGKYQVFIANLTIPFNFDLTQLPIADLGEQNSVVFLWVSNQGLAEGIKIMNSWGFQYHHCMIRNNDFMEDITANADILIIGIKGNHPDLIQNTNSFEKIAMPRRIVELISATYAGSKLEILPDGWSIWGNEV